MNVSPIQRDSVVFPEDSELKYFYEPKPSTIETDSPEWLGYTATYTINSDALNERFEYPSEKPTNTFRIVTIGDSFTFGLYVDTEDNYPEKLEDALNEMQCNNYDKFEVINSGRPGHGIEYCVENFKRRGEKYHPDLVIWLMNDWNITNLNELIQPRLSEIYDEATISGKYEEKVKERGIHFNFIQAEQEITDQLGLDNIIDMNVSYFDDFRNYYKGPVLIVNTSDNLFGHLDRFINKIKYSHQDLYFFNDIKLSELDTVKVDEHPTSDGYTVIADKLKTYLIDNFYICSDKKLW